MPVNIPPTELERLDALRRFSILDTSPEQVYDDITLIASQICDTPIAAISLIDENRQWFKSIMGVEVTETPREIAFCSHTILGQDVMVVPDTTNDERFANNPLVTGDSSIRFYAGAPLITSGGHAIGSLCVIDRKCRTLTTQQEAALRVLSRNVMAQIELQGYIEAQEILVAARAKAELEQRNSERQFRTAIESMQEGIVMQDADGVVRICNKSAEEILGLPADQIKGTTSVDPRWQCVREDMSDFPGADHPAPQILKTGKPVSDVIMGVYKPSGDLCWISVSGNPLFQDGESKPYAAVCTFVDITAERASQFEISRLASIVDNSGDAVIGGTIEGTIVSWNKGAESMLGYDKSEIVGCSIATLFTSPESWCDGKIRKSLNTGMTRENIEALCKRKDGTTLKASLTYSPILDSRGGVIGFGCIGRDITDQKIYEQQIKDFSIALQFQMAELEKANKVLAELSTTDGLTGLHNHRSFQESLSKEYRRLKRYELPLSLMMIDVDDFKSYNDKFGHPAGDIILKKVAEILKQTCRDTDICARYGGEEFVVLLPQTDILGATTIAERVRAAIEQYEWPKRNVTISIGVSVSKADFKQHNEMVNEADKALYRSKSEGKNRVTLWERPSDIRFAA